jgi:hypothetical protein
MKVKESILETLSAFNEEEKDLKDRSPPNWRAVHVDSRGAKRNFCG